MSYKSLVRTHERHQLQVLAILLVLFVVAWAFMFVHPSITLLLFWIGLIVVGISTLMTRRAHKAEQQAARTELRAHHCPRCDAPLDRDDVRMGERGP